ncbi:alpha/beta-hydrolase, partial [Choiromyces venosus 120613-1]
ASGPTLLPAPVASLVSLISRSATVSIRLGSIIGGTVLDSARLGTLTGLEIGRAAAEGILVRAGRDVRDDGWADRGIKFVRSSISLTQLLLSAGFEIGLTTITTVSGLAETYVLTLDSIFGSTESSRAISAIVALIKKEIEENEAGEGKVGVSDLVIGLSCFAILQMKTKKRRELGIKMDLEWDEVVEDITDVPRKNENTAVAVFHEASGGETGGLLPALMFQNFPDSADISVTTSSTTTNTTTIEVIGSNPPDFAPPPGAVVLSESSQHDASRPHYRIVYETTTKKSSNKRMKRAEGEFVEAPSEDQGRILGEVGAPPPLPLKEKCREKRVVKSLDESQSHGRSGSAGFLDVPIEANQRKRITALSNSSSSSKRSKERSKDKEGRRSSKRPVAPQEKDKDKDKDKDKEKEKKKKYLTSQSLLTLGKSKELSSRNKSLLPRADSSELRFTETDNHTPPGHSRNGSYAPSIYTIRTSQSQTSLLLESSTPLVFPSGRLIENLSKYMRFASASYGQKFLRLFGIGNAPAAFPATASHHAEHHSFSYHTSLPVDTILLSSFTDPGGGYDADGEVNTGIPLVHFVAVDHGAQAVVVTCRGTLGLEDVLTDLTCEYADLWLRGTKYRAHKGMLNSALLLIKKNSRLLNIIKSSLEQFPGYGLVLCGHSLGGGVAAILAILLSAPSGSSSGPYTTTNAYIQLLHSSSLRIPEGRQIHCYAYGPPACISEPLRRRTRSLITSVVNGNDCIPTLSFGIIRDFWTVAVAFKTDTQGTKAEIRNRILQGLTSGNVSGIIGDGDDWAWSVVKTCRAGMLSEKLVPPGKVYKIQ